jgi:hypothetical protein
MILTAYLISNRGISQEVTEIPTPEYVKYIFLGVVILMIIGANILSKR